MRTARSVGSAGGLGWAEPGAYTGGIVPGLAAAALAGAALAEPALAEPAGLPWAGGVDADLAGDGAAAWAGAADPVGAAAAAGAGGGDAFESARLLQAEGQSFNIRYLELQERMQRETREFTAVSNVMKVRHDAARAAIQNVQ
jgi:hypothetical protein